MENKRLRVLAWAGIFVLALSATLFLFFTPENAEARWRSYVLDSYASIFAGRDVHVECSSTDEDLDLYYNDPNSWSLGYVYVPTGQQKETFVWEGACWGALAIDSDSPDVSDHMKSLGMAAILHEAFHLKQIKWNQNEAITECRAMRNFDRALESLGAEPSTIKRLMPIALLDHFSFRAQTPQYNKEGCKLPQRYWKYLGV